MKQLAYILVIVSFLSIPIAILRPVPIVKESEAITEKVVVSYVYEGGVKDVCFRVKDSDRVYYINRGLEGGLVLSDLKEKLMGKEVTFKYPEYWTPLDWNNRIKHLSKVEYGGEVIFNELL